MDGPTNGTRTPPAWIGKPMPRREDLRLLQGRGVFVGDLTADGCLYLDLLRSPFGAGTITTLDVTDATALPGVVAVFTAQTLPSHAPSAVNPLLPNAHITPMDPLATTRIGAVGQPVVAVVATSPAIARDALDLIVLDVDESTPQPAPQTTAEWGNPLPPFQNPVHATVNHALLAPFAMEPRTALAIPDKGTLTVWLSTQTPQRARDDLCAMLNLPRDHLRVIAPDVGGAFGGKASLSPEDFITAAVAQHLQRPVKWVASRSDDFLSATQGRGAQTMAEMDITPDGRAIGLRADLTFPLGHWMPYSALAPIRNAGRILPGPYAIPHHVTAHANPTQGAAVNIYRGAGRPEAAMLMERLMDRAAAQLGIDPMEMRRRNISTQFGGDDTPCSANFTALLDRLESETDYTTLRQAQTAARAKGKVCGLGLALYVEPCGQGWETAHLTLQPDGSLLAATGSSAQGQGRETAMAQIVAQALNINPAQIHIIQGDTNDVPDAIGALASRSTAIGGTAMWRAANDLLAQARTKAAATLACQPDQITATPDGLFAKGQTIAWSTLAPLQVSIRHTAGAEAWASGAILAEISIDPETGALTITKITWVDDAGTVINPLLVQGQLLGGAAQGIGAATMERMVYADGQLQTGSLMDYALPRAIDMPPIHLFSQPTPSPANPLGVKGVGEAGCIGIPAAILNAVMDALPPGTPDLALPLTSEALWRAVHTHGIRKTYR